MSKVQKGGPARVLVRSTDVVERKFDNFTSYNQTAYLVISEDVRHEMSLRVESKDDPYPPGQYLVGAASFRTDDYGRLVVSKRGIVLVPDPSVPAAPAQAPSGK